MFAKRRHRLVAAAIIAALAIAPATADEHKLVVRASVLVAPVLRELVPAFEAATGVKIEATYRLANAVATGVRAGEPCDVALGPQAAMIALATDGLARPDPVVVARSGIGIAVRHGAVKPPLATVNAFKAALLAAGTIGYTDPALGGASGVYVSRLIDRLGLADDLKAKTQLARSGSALNDSVAHGDVALGLLTISEILTNPGVDLAAPFPAEIQNVTTVSAAITTATKSGDDAQTFIAYLRSPAAATLFAAKGLKPSD